MPIQPTAESRKFIAAIQQVAKDAPTAGPKITEQRARSLVRELHGKSLEANKRLLEVTLDYVHGRSQYGKTTLRELERVTEEHCFAFVTSYEAPGIARQQESKKAKTEGGPAPIACSLIDEHRDFCEALADIAMALQYSQGTGRTTIPDSRAVVALALEWADEFYRQHGATDWDQQDYLETVDAFTAEKLRPYEHTPVRQLAAFPLPDQASQSGPSKAQGR